MWRSIAEWLLAFLNMARELQEHRTTIRRLEERVRDLEEAIKLLAVEQRHARDIAAVERDKLLLQIERELTRHKALPPARRAEEPKTVRDPRGSRAA
jgi:hypothetical protein